MQDDWNPTPFAAVILAAGRGSRMGRPKGLIRLPDGESFVLKLIYSSRAAGLDPIVVVGRPTDGQLADDVSQNGTILVTNPRPDEGQLSSLLAGLRAVEGGSSAGVVVLPVDVPLVSADVLRQIVRAAESSAAAIVRAVYRTRHGHPVLFKRAVFDELRRADPMVGARAVVRADPSRVLDLEVDDEGVTIDIDTPEDYERTFGRPL